MGLFDLLRGFGPGAEQPLVRNPWTASANPPPSWLFGPAAYDWSDVASPMPLPDRLDAPDVIEPTPASPDLSLDDIRAQLLAGAASRIGPEHFALNPDNWAPPLVEMTRARTADVVAPTVERMMVLQQRGRQSRARPIPRTPMRARHFLRLLRPQQMS
jgi:hypothetical protein